MGYFPWPILPTFRFDALNTALKAAGEDTRLRVLVLLAEAELTVSDLTQILRQSQPRISRHLKLLVEAGLVERFREGAWAFFRLAERGGARRARARAGRAARCRRPDRGARPRAARRGAARPRRRRRRTISARTPRSGTASASCTSPTRRSSARSATRSPSGRSARCSISAPAPAACWKCSAPGIERGLGIDLSLDMLLLARARIERAGLAPLQRAAGRHLRSRGAGGLVRRRASSIRCCTSSTTARARSARPRACWRRPAGCWWSISRRTIWNSCARSTRIAGSALPPRPWRNG